MKSKECKIGQKVNMHHNEVATEASANPTELAGAEKTVKKGCMEKTEVWVLFC